MSEYDVELDAVGVPAESEKGKIETERLRPKPKSQASTARGGARKAGRPKSECPRWMFHRKGEFCKTCEKVIT